MDFWLLIAIITVAAVLFVTELVPVDVLSLALAVILMLTGLVTVQQGLSGFSSEATVTVAAFFVLASALSRTGFPTRVAQRLVALTRSHPLRFLAALMPLSALSASFLHVTGVVAVYLPVVLDAARALRTSPSKYLIPLSYAAQFGGVCTLLGTTSNLVVSAIMVAQGMAPIGMFEITGLGLTLFVAGFLYLLLVGWHLLPDRPAERDLPRAYGLDRYLIELVVTPHSSLRGNTLGKSDLRARAGLHVLEIVRGELRLTSPSPREVLQAGDLLRVKATLDDVMQRAARLGLALPDSPPHEPSPAAPVRLRLVEALVSSGSSVVRRTVREVEFRGRYGVSVLALKRRGRITLTDLRDVPLRRNDTLLVQGTVTDLRRLQDSPDFIVLSRVAVPAVRQRNAYLAIATLLGVVVATTFHVVPIAVSTMVAALFLVGAGVMTNRQAYECIEWRVVMMVAGVIPLGVAVSNQGVAQWVAQGVISVVGKDPWMLLCASYFATMVVTEFVTHVACAVLMTPIVISIAVSAGLDPRPFCIAVIFATDTSFSTPVGYQANAMIFNTGGYRFSDFLRVGLPLNLLFWMLSSILIPKMWPLVH